MHYTPYLVSRVLQGNGDLEEQADLGVALSKLQPTERAFLLEIGRGYPIGIAAKRAKLEINGQLTFIDLLRTLTTLLNGGS